MSTPVELIKEKLPIVDVARSYFKVEKAGRNFKARCPFHSEKTPSFFLSPDRNTFYCFGCGAKGDIFSLVERFEGLDFRGALIELAKRAHVSLGDFSGAETKDQGKDVLLAIHEQASQFFENVLSQHEPVRAYLHARGLRDDTIESWRLGYAEEEWRSLHDALKSKGYADIDIERSGFIKKADTRYYDRFRGRVMFPIKDASGRIIAFSGRLFEEKTADSSRGDAKEHDAPKYLNSPETPIFRKSAVLYGLDRAKGSIRKSDFSIIVEGQMDLLMMHQVGFINTVATSGTSLTEEHLRILKRFSDNVVLAMDGDKAGFQSTLRGAELALRLGMNVKVAVFPPSLDPAEVAKDNPGEVKRIIKDSQHVIDFLLEDIQKRGYDERKFRLTVQKEALPFIQLLENRIDREHFVQRVSHRLNISEEAVREELKKVPAISHGVVASTREDRVEDVSQPVGQQVKNRLVGLLLVEEGKEDRAIDTVALRATLEKYGTIPTLEEVKGERESLLFETERLYEEEGLLKEEAAELVKVLEQAYIKATYQERLRELRKAEAVRDDSEIARLLKECSELSKELEKLKKQ